MSQNVRRRAWIVATLGIALCVSPCRMAGAQSVDAAPVPDASLGSALRSLASRAGVVFVGQVTQIDRSGDVVLISFRVDQALVGNPPSPYVLREWAGLWPMGEQRYYPGQRALIFLRTPSSAGLSTPVDDAEGVVPVLPQGAENIPLLDVRRLDTRILRHVGDALPSDSASAVLLSDAATVVRTWQQPTWTEPPRHALPPEIAPAVEASSGARRLAPSLPRPIPAPGSPAPATLHTISAVPAATEPYAAR